MENFQYESFDLDKPAFRLLRLLRGNELDIKCELFQAYLDDESTIAYEALSYTWGGMDLSEVITINGRRLGVTLNLYLALRNLRLQDEDRILWVDAICIHQGNETEQGHQVRQMGKIYSQAHQVLIWLGPATDQTNVLLSSLKRLEHESIQHACGTWNLENWRMLWLSIQPALKQHHYRVEIRQREGLDFLLARPWFKRVWILQEVANAKRAVVYSGIKSVSTRIFALAPQLLGMNPEPHCQAVLDIMPGHLGKDSWWNHDRDLYTLLRKFDGSQASNPRDMVYALLDISSDARNTNSLRVDYTKDCKQIVLEAASFLFSLSAEEYQRSLNACYPRPENIHTMSVFKCSFGILNIASLCDLARSGDANGVAEFLKRRGDNVRLTDTVVAAAARNTKSGKEILEFLIRKRENEVKITEEVVAAAAGNTKSGKEVLEFLIRKRENEVKITEKVVAAAAGNTKSGKAVLEFLIRKRAHLVRITEVVVVAAAGNSGHGIEVMRFLLQHREAEIFVTSEVVTAAARNPASGKEVMDLLYDLRGEEVVTAAVKSGSNAMKLLLQGRKSLVEVTEKVLVEAALNRYEGRQVLELLLQQHGYEFKITERMTMAAAGHGERGMPFMRLLLERFESEIKITENVMSAAARNGGCGDDITRLLLERFGSKIKITERVMLSAAENQGCGDRITKLLLWRFKSEIKITENMMLAAAGNRVCGDEIKRLLIEQTEYKSRATKKAMRRLLRQPEYKSQVTKKVVATATRNSEKGEEVMEAPLE